jgi:hypothetical protein
MLLNGIGDSDEFDDIAEKSRP